MDGALYQAAKNGQEAVVQLLLKHMVDIDAKDDGRTVPHWAAKNGHEAEVRLLLKHMVDVDANMTMNGRRYTGWLRMGTRQWCSCYWITRMDIDTKDDDGQTALPERLRMGMADVDAKDNNGRTAMY